MDYAQTIMALIALGGVAVAFVSVRMAKAQIAASVEIAEKQIRAQLVSANRLQWIEGLRSDVADFIALTVLFIATDTPRVNADKAERMLRTAQVIALRLNPNEEEHQDLAVRVNSLTDVFAELVNDRLAGKQLNAKTIEALKAGIGDLTSSARVILKSEWERVKRGE